MGKASSSKKIARAARAGGRVSGVRQRNLLFPGAIGAIILAGSALVVVARADHQDDAENIPPQLGDHWHSAYGFYICDEFVPAAGEFESPVGIHTHNNPATGEGDGVIHIHPSSSGGAGENATLGVFLEEAGIELTDDELTIGEDTWENHETECGDDTGELVVVRWKEAQTTDQDPSLIYNGFDDLRFRENGEAYTIAFVPEDETDIPQPPSAAQLAELGALDDPNASTTTVPGETTTTAGGGSTTTAPPANADTTATTAAP